MKSEQTAAWPLIFNELEWIAAHHKNERESKGLGGKHRGKGCMEQRIGKSCSTHKRLSVYIYQKRLPRRYSSAKSQSIKYDCRFSIHAIYGIHNLSEHISLRNSTYIVVIVVYFCSTQVRSVNAEIRLSVSLSLGWDEWWYYRYIKKSFHFSARIHLFLEKQSF